MSSIEENILEIPRCQICKHELVIWIGIMDLSDYSKHIDFISLINKGGPSFLPFNNIITTFLKRVGMSDEFTNRASTFEDLDHITILICNEGHVASDESKENIINTAKNIIRMKQKNV